MSFPRYERYKDSGVEWLGEVPEHWQIFALKRTAHLQSGESIAPEAIEPVGEYPVYGGNGLRGFTSTFTHNGDYTLIGRQGALCGNINYASGEFWASEHAIVVTPTCDVDRTWLGELLREMNLNQYSIASAQPGLSVDNIRKLSIASPTLSEQRAIGHFLRHETAKIDPLIEEQRRLIELLKEKRQALISHAVTKGLNPNAIMKESGIEWLGRVPEHWNPAVLVRVASRIVVGIAEAATHAYAEEGVPILRSTNVRAGRIVGDILRVLPDFANERGSKLISSGDLITVRTGNAGVTAVVPPELDGCQCFTMLITSLLEVASPHFYCYYMNSDVATSYFGVEGWGTAQVNISVPILKALPIPIPPIDEQDEIVAYLDAQTARLDALSSETEHVVLLLQERRSALISAAVTGKIDVRNYRPKEAA